MDAEVIVIGAGVAGLAALLELERAQVRAVCVEARDRIGGRIDTIRRPECPVPIELGAEFIHGRPPEIWNIAEQHSLGIYDCRENAVHMKDGRKESNRDAWQLVEQVMNEMQERARSGPDVPFSEFLSHADQPQSAKAMAMSFVEGFNAAHGDEIGIASLAQDARASDEIDGDRSFRIRDGYDSVPRCLAASLLDGGNSIQTGTIVEAILWQPGSVGVHVRSSWTAQQRRINARGVIITVPLGILQADESETGAIHFDPAPGHVLEAARQLRVGQVMRTVLFFRDRIWEEKPELADAGFILAGDASLPTWWTPLPMRAPVLTGWSAGRKAEALFGRCSDAVLKHMTEGLSRTSGLSIKRIQSSLRAAFFHDWHSDPFARGAYSYTPAGALAARTAMTEPVHRTLFFAGEATENNGHSGTVHGAIASGCRAAKQVIESIR